MEQQKSPFLKWALIVGIIIVSNLFIHYALSLVYPAPEFESNPVVQSVGYQSDYTEESCISVGGQWTKTYEKSPDGKEGYCDPDFTKRTEYEIARKVYERNIFLILISLGVVMLGVGLAFTHEIVAIALSWAGVLSFIIASMRYWSSAHNSVRVGILGIALAALIWMSIKKFSK